MHSWVGANQIGRWLKRGFTVLVLIGLEPSVLDGRAGNKREASPLPNEDHEPVNEAPRRQVCEILVPRKLEFPE
jgi:hypothetical protein